MRKRFYFLILMLIGIFFSGCQTKEGMDSYYLSLTGESENWKLTHYEIVMTPHDFKVGNGRLTMENESEYITSSFHFSTYIVTDEEPMRIHSGSTTGLDINIAEEVTGAIEGDNDMDEDGQAINPSDINAIYMTVDWWDTAKEENVEERIELYTIQEETFLE